MRRTLRASKLCGVDSRDLVRLELRLEPDAEPIRGFVRAAEDADWRPFRGWLNLARELEQARERDEPSERD